MTNAQRDFCNIDVKLLPEIVETVQRYSNTVERSEDDPKPGALSIVYEVMRKWDKVFPSYKQGGGADDTTT